MRSPALLLLLLFLTASLCLAQKPSTPSPDPQETIKVDTNLVSVPVLITDRSGKYVGGLNQSNFTLFQDGRQVRIEFFATEEEPLKVAILLDSSMSTIPILGDIKHAARDFVKRLGKADVATVVSFDHEVKSIASLTSDHKALEKAIDSIKSANSTGTVMREAVNSIIAGQFKNLKGRKAIIVLTDGQDRGSGISEDDLLDISAESDTVIYPIFFFNVPPVLARTAPAPRIGRMGIPGRGGMMGPRFPRPDRERQQEARRQQRRNRMERRFGNVIEYLQELAGASGGRFYRAESTDLKKAFGDIAEELRHQYRLGFYPPEEKERGTLHQLNVRLDRIDLVVRSRRQYALPRP